MGALAPYGEHTIAVDTFKQFASYMDSQVGEIDGKKYSDIINENNFHIVVTDKNGNDETLDNDTAQLPFNDNDKIITIMPVVDGESGELQIFLGANIAVAGLFAGPFAPLVSSVGISLIGSGVATLLAPTPPDTTAREGSSIFNGANNLTQIGVAIPLVFGETRTGSIVASAGVDVVQIESLEDSD